MTTTRGADRSGGVPSPERRPESEQPDGVRPLDWLRAVTRHPFPVESTKVVKGKTSALAVAMVLGTLAPGRPHRATGWTFYASGPTLQGLAGLGESSVTLVLGQLRAAGFLVLVVRGGGRNRTANTWRLALPEGSGTPVPQSTEDRARTPVPQSTGDSDGTPVPGTEVRDGTPVPKGSNSRALGHGPRESYTKRASSSSGQSGTGRARDEFADDDDEPRDEQPVEVEPITDAEVAEIVAASEGRWQTRGVRKHADEFARTFGRADALRRLTAAALDPSARTPKVAAGSKYAPTSLVTEVAEGPREPVCRTCGLVEHVCTRTLESDHPFEPAHDDGTDAAERTPTRRGRRRTIGEPDAIGDLVGGVLRS